MADYDFTHPMRVLYDGSIYMRQSAGGINRYFANLIAHLPDSMTPILATARRREHNFPRHKNLCLHVKDYRLLAFRALQKLAWRGHLRRLANRIDADLIHATYYDSLAARTDDRSKRPLVITVHDMIHERFHELLDPTGKHVAMKRNAIHRADAIICVSHQTREDLVDLYPQVRDIVTVVHHGTGMGELAPDGWIPPGDRPFFLFVGSRAWYKNYDRMLQSLKLLVSQRPEVQLRTIGAPFRPSETARIAKLGLQDHVINHGYVTDSRLARLYHLSVALVYPSLYEGFGIPLLEAMSCGTPVLAAHSSSLPEVAGDAAVYFNPLSTHDMMHCLREVLDNSSFREALIQRGVRRCRRFDWRRTTQETLAVYRSVVAPTSIPWVRLHGEARRAGPVEPPDVSRKKPPKRELRRAA
jgi:glycosyltransferase involved in cell wall biosynthesis